MQRSFGASGPLVPSIGQEAGIASKATGARRSRPSGAGSISV